MMKETLFNLKWAVLLMLPLLFVACSNDDEMEPEPPVEEPKNIVEYAAGDANFSTLVEALTKAELVATLEQDGPFTVFAPTNAAFTAAGIDVDATSKEDLQTVLLYHVLGAKVLAGDLTDNQQTYTTTASTNADGDQYSLLIERAGANVTLNGSAMVTTADVDLTNGVIHVIDEVLAPLNVVGHAQANSNFTTLVGALAAADGDLVNVLSGDGPFTVFAPVNSAFAEIQTVVDGLTTEQLSKVLTYHVAAGNTRAGDLSNPTTVTTVNGEEFTINIDGSSVSITDANGGVANIILTDVQGTNGVIHVLDKVIIPENL